MPKKQKEETGEKEKEKKVVKPRAKKTKETEIHKETIPIHKETDIPKETIPILREIEKEKEKETKKQPVAIVEHKMNEKKEHKLPISKSITNKALSASDFLQKWGYNSTVQDIVLPKHYDFVQKIVALENMKKKK